MKTDMNKLLEDIVSVQPIDGDIFKNLYESAKRFDDMINSIKGVTPMTDEEYKKFSDNSLFKINHISKEDDNQKLVCCLYHQDLNKKK